MAFPAKYAGRCARCGARFPERASVNIAPGRGPKGGRLVQHAGVCPSASAPAPRATRTALRAAVAAESAPAAPVVSLDTATAVGGTVAAPSVDLGALAATAAGVRRTAASYMTFMDTPVVRDEREAAEAARAERAAAFAARGGRVLPPATRGGPVVAAPAGPGRWGGLELDGAEGAPVATDPARETGAERFRGIELD